MDERKILTLRETHQAALDVLKRVDSVCRMEGLRYWVAYGTAIGALRHKGFIPWDDDLDIYMPRPDYERLLEHFDNHANDLKPLVAIRRTDQNPRVPFLITRISDTTFKMIGEHGECIDEMGAFIDIYPVDGLGNDKRLAVKKKRRCFKLAYAYLQASNFEYYNKTNGFFKGMAKHCLSVLRGDPGKYLQMQQRILSPFNFETSRYVGVVVWAGSYLPVVFERDLFDETDYIDFEDMEVPIPAGCDVILNAYYGDYMKYPPKSDQVGHHYYSIVRRSHE